MEINIVCINSVKKDLYILQFRTDETLAADTKAFSDEYADRDVNLIFVDALTRGFENIELDSALGVILGGSGELYLSEGHGKGTWQEPLFSFMDDLHIKDIPTLGICFGYQLIALHQGGAVGRDEQKAEIGSFLLSAENHIEDPVFGHLPNTYYAQLGHRDHVSHFPDHLEILGHSDLVYGQKFKVKDKHMWGCLQHPELSRERVISRLSMSPDYATGVEADHILSSLQESKESTDILHAFVDHATGEGKSSK